MAERIYIRDRQGELEPLEEEPFATEANLQALIAEHPEVLDGEQMRPGDPLRWILVTREQGIAESSSDAVARWAVDHLIVDQDAVPTLVEVKRGTNREVRRSIVGQMLEYAAHATQTGTADELRRAFEDTARSRDLDPDEELRTLLGTEDLLEIANEESDADRFWKRVATNLAASRLRLLFVADSIPDSLKRVVEFLNAQMPSIEVLAVEIKQFKGSSSKQTLVPRVIGRTAASPRSGGSGARRRRLDRESFLNVLTVPEHRSVAERLLDVAGADLNWGANGVSVRLACPGRIGSVDVAWLFPSSEPGKAVWHGLAEVSLGTSLELPATPASLREEERPVCAALQRWVEEIAGYDFAKDAPKGLARTIRSDADPARSSASGWHKARRLAWIIRWDDAARNIDRLASGLERIVSEVRAARGAN